MGSSGSSRKIKTNKVSGMQDLMLFFAVKEGSPQAVKLAAKLKNWKKLIISDTQWTLLHLASWYGHSELCNELVLLGADANAKDSVRLMQHLETPLHIAVFRKHLQTIKVLVKFPLERNPTNFKGQTPLDLAREGADQDVVAAVEEWNARSATLRSATLNIVDI